MGDLGATLIKELNCETAFTIGGIGISESVVVTWIMMAVVLVVSLIVTHGLKVEYPGRGQLLLENAVTWLQGIGEGILGEEGKGYAPYLTSVLMYLGVANLLGILGFKPPTKDLNVTAALALMSIVLIETAGIRVKGLKGWLKSFTEPIAIVTPINIMEIFIKPLSLCMRLFGNVLGAFVIMKLIEYILPVGLPVLFSAYFDIFDGLIQAYVFVFLTGAGAGIGIGIATSKATEAVARQPEAEGKITKILLLGAALAEATAIYGFVIALLIIILLS